MPKSDEEIDDLESTQDETTSSKKTSESALVADLKRRISKRDQQFNKLNERITTLEEEASTKEIEHKQAVLTLQGQLTASQTELTQKTGELSKTASERDRLKSAKDAAAVISEKYPQAPHLINDLLIGDLKLRDDFETDEAYDKYLARQAKRVLVEDEVEEVDDEEEEVEVEKPQKPLKQLVRGTVPSGNTRVVASNKGKRDALDISEEMMATQAGTPKYKELQAELQEATTRK